MKSRVKPSRVTITDVAERAGVSVMTVSRVVNRDDKVRDSTRARVEQAIEDLHYLPNTAARALVGSTVQKICLLYGNPSSAYLGELLVGAVDAASNAGAHLIVERTDASIDPGQLALRFGKDWDAVIVPPPISDIPIVRSVLATLDAPAVFLGSAAQSGAGYEIRIDDRQAAYEMTKTLLDLGHERIGFIKGDPNQTVSDSRLTGYRDALHEAAATLDPQLVHDGAFTYRSGLEAATALLRLPSPPTAIFASNDDMAAGCLAAAAHAGLQVPQKLSVVGFDDSPIASVVWPPLTTLRQPVAEMAAMAVKALVSAKGGRLPSETHIVEHVIVDRESANKRI